MRKRRLNKLLDKYDSLDERLWYLEHPAKYKLGDRVKIDYDYHEDEKKYTYTVIGKKRVLATFGHYWRYDLIDKDFDQLHIPEFYLIPVKKRRNK